MQPGGEDRTGPRTGEDLRGQERTPEDRRGQARTGQDPMAQVTLKESCRESRNNLFLNQITQATEMLDQSQREEKKS